MDKAKKEGKPFFLWHNTTRMHVWTFLSKKYSLDDEQRDELRPGGGRREAARQLRRRTHESTWTRHRRGRQHRSSSSAPTTAPRYSPGRRRHDAVQGHHHGTVYEGGFRRASPAGRQDQARHGPDASSPASTGSRRCVAAAGNPNITDAAPQGREARRPNLQEPPRRLQPDEPADGTRDPQPATSFLLREAQPGRPAASTISSSSSIRQPNGWPGGKVTTDMPGMVNIRQDPFERTPSIRSRESLNNLGGGYVNDFYAREFWRFVLVQQRRGRLARTAIELPADAGPGLLQPGGGEAADRRRRHRNKPGQWRTAMRPIRAIRRATISKEAKHDIRLIRGITRRS